ncbi:MAG: hypothetical protein WDA42_09855 [Candidatus Bathyarchaeia archaeon]|jgi:hypothetical protein
MYSLFLNRCGATDMTKRHGFELTFTQDGALPQYTFKCEYCGFSYSVPANSLLPQEMQLVKKAKAN